MKHARKLFALFAAAAVLAAVAVPAHGSPTGGDVPAAQSSKKPKLRAAVEACGDDGYATFTGTMPARGAQRSMEMRFDLQERVRKTNRRGKSGNRWVTVKDVPSFGVWDTADAGVPGFIVRKRVGGLEPGTLMRAVVHYRWRNPGGRVVRRAKRTTKKCSLTENRPDLRIRNPDVIRGHGDDPWTYRVIVSNDGRGASGEFDLALALGGITVARQRISGLAPRERLVVALSAPRCEPGAGVQFTADSAGEVAESRENNNVLQRRCGRR